MRAFELLEKCTAVQLRRLCFNTGIPCSGTKPIIIESIKEKFMEKSVLEYATPNNGVNFNILSIDMGIRNFAFTKIELNKQLPFNRPPLVKEWTKFDINDWAGETQKNSFEPSEYTKVCSRLVDEVLLPKGEPLPDAILIERQRARTGGSSIVQEWVFRVNMLEAMLHALIYTRVTSEKCRVDIVSTSPQRMTQYWKPDDSESSMKNSDSKNLRIDVVEKWLKDMIYPKPSTRQMIQLDPQRFKLSKEVAATSKSRNKWLTQVLESHSSFAKTAGDGGKAKVDDLTDSLLHAISWLEWQSNKMVLKLEMLSELENALTTSDKMSASHQKELEFLKHQSSKPDSRSRASSRKGKADEESGKGATESSPKYKTSDYPNKKESRTKTSSRSSPEQVEIMEGPFKRLIDPVA